METIEENDSASGIGALVDGKMSGFRRTDPQNKPEKNNYKIKTSTVVNQKFTCGICKVNRGNVDKLESHMLCHDEEGDWTCEDCSYQTNNVLDLRKHMKVTKHKSSLLTMEDNISNETGSSDRESSTIEGDFSCPICDAKFKFKDQITLHRKENHPTYKPCRNILSESGCQFGDTCKYNHKPVQTGFNICFECGSEFPSYPMLMLHRKKEHNNNVVCRRFLQNNCHFTNESCWFSHVICDGKVPLSANRPTYAQSVQKHNTQSQVFQEEMNPSETPPTAEIVLMKMFEMMSQLFPKKNMVIQ
jgi:hypothetical protein